MTIHDDHPRRDSLLSRQKIVDAQNKGLLADSALIAHGRGEAFDYLLGECTTPSARRAEEESVNRLAAARRTRDRSAPAPQPRRFGTVSMIPLRQS